MRAPSIVITLAVMLLVSARAGEVITGARKTTDQSVAAVMNAAAAGDLASLRQLLEAYPSLPRARDSGGLTALHHAARAGQIAAAELLLSRGASVNAASTPSLPDKPYFGSTPLHEAAAAGLFDTAGFRRPTSDATTKGRPLEMAAFLLEKGADPNAATSWGWTPLHLAAQRGDQATVALLVDKGADPNAALRPYPTLERLGQTPLHLAIKWGHAETALLLIAKGANVTTRAGHGQGLTPLQLAAHKGDIAVVQALLAAGAPAGATRPRERTPLHLAADGATARLLLMNGAGVDARDEQGQTPLHMARSAEVVAVLLSFGATIGAQDEEGRTPLHMRAWAGNRAVVEALLAHGAEAGATDRTGRTPLHGAGESAITELLLASGADPNAQDMHGVTPLQLAYDAAVAEALLARGANPSAASSEGWTALHEAIRDCNRPLAELLVAHGADVNAADKDGYTPLHWAVLRAQGSDVTEYFPIPAREIYAGPAIVELLVTHHASLAAKTKVARKIGVHDRPPVSIPAGSTPLAIAKLLGYRDIASVLRLHGASR